MSYERFIRCTTGSFGEAYQLVLGGMVVDTYCPRDKPDRPSWMNDPTLSRSVFTVGGEGRPMAVLECHYCGTVGDENDIDPETGACRDEDGCGDRCCEFDEYDTGDVG